MKFINHIIVKFRDLIKPHEESPHHPESARDTFLNPGRIRTFIKKNYSTHCSVDFYLHALLDEASGFTGN